MTQHFRSDYDSVTLAPDGGTVPDQYGAVAGVDGEEDPGSTPGGPSVILPSTTIATATSGSFRNGHGSTETCVRGKQFAAYAEPVTRRPTGRGHEQHAVRDDAG